MTTTVEELIQLLSLERLEDNLFRGPSRDIGTTRVYGGQVLGQAIKAAQATVEERIVHSLHAYFLREGDHNAPIVYDVDRSRDGGSFSSRRVVAIQHGRPIFTMAASFQQPESGFSHQSAMPKVPPADELPEIKTHHEALARQLPEKIMRVLRNPAASFDLRPIEPIVASKPEPGEPHRHMWLRIPEPLPDDDMLHRALLAYVSDYGLLTTALVPHGLNFMDHKLQMASLDHAMWFHRPFRMDEWILYATDSPTASGARGLTRGAFYSSTGELIASTVQEGLLRVRSRD